MLIVATLTITMPLLTLIVWRMSALKGMAISLCIVAVTASIVWGMSWHVMIASTIQGLYKAASIVFILYGATVLLQTLKKTKAVQAIERSFHLITDDLHILLILLAFLFGSLIEGVAGFGTPAVIVAPLLVALGFRPIAAVVLTLVGNKTSVPFGAVGTPTVVGFSNVDDAGWSLYQQLATGIIQLDFINIVVTPLVLLWMYRHFFDSTRQSIRPYVRWALLIGIVYAGLSFLFVSILGLEFVSIVTPLVTLIVAIWTVRRRFLLPTSVIQQEGRVDRTIVRAWSPYVIIVSLLIFTRTIPPVRQWMSSYGNIDHVSIGNIHSIDGHLDLLYSPALILLIAAWIGVLLHRQSSRVWITALRDSVQTVWKAALTLCCTLIMVQLFTNSSYNATELVSMPEYLVSTIIPYVGSVWLFVSPVLGQLGTFITGSATVSTLTFAPIQANAAIELDLPVQTMLATQMIGAASGTMVSINNIVAASATLGLIGKEGEIIMKTIWPATLYALGTACITLIFIA